MIPGKFLKKYNTIIIEPDGIITSNQQFLICAALTAYEMCNSDSYFGKSPLDFSSVFKNQKQISDLLFCGGKLIDVLEELGIDYPIDIAYVLFSVIMGIGERRDFNNIYNYFKYIDIPVQSIFEHCSMLLARVLPDEDCKHGGTLWQNIKKCYYEWLFGDELYELCFGEAPKVKGKTAVISKSSLYSGNLIDIKDMFSNLRQLEKNISFYTLHTRFELNASLRYLNLSELLENTSIVSYDDIIEGGHLPNVNNPSDPDPYGLAKAGIGDSFSKTAYENGEYADIYAKTLVVSSSPMTLFSAQTLGMGFAAVVGNHTDKYAKDTFRQLEADYVLDSLGDFFPSEKAKTRR